MMNLVKTNNIITHKYKITLEIYQLATVNGSYYKNIEAQNM